MGIAARRLLCVVCLILIALPGCRRTSSGRADSDRFPIEAGKYRILGIRTDNNDHGRAKQNAEAAINGNPNLKCMVGLWAYNPPQILNAVEEAGKLDEIAIVGFDENEATLRGIEAGKIHGTIVQQPFVFGYKSVEYLSGLIRDQGPEVPDSKLIFIPHQTIRQDNVAEFQAEIARINAGEGTPPPHDRDDYDTSEPVKIGFLTNTVDPFWNLAEAGVRRAEPIFNAECDVYHPSDGTTEQQKRYIERKMGDGCQGLAISPIDPDSQTSLIDQAAETMVVICHDSDAPKSKRLFYIGTGNYLAGRAAGKLVKEAIPDGGDVMIFVGKMEVLNAQERSQGVIDELLDKPIPEMYSANVE
ncbi:MAG: substrate-binding domain-containing protein [Pirellulaceae bacterium]